MFEIDDEDNKDLTDVITGNNGLIYTGKIMAYLLKKPCKYYLH